jgi:energy-coupling factor transport system ATP-binding protein
MWQVHTVEGTGVWAGWAGHWARSTNAEWHVVIAQCKCLVRYAPPMSCMWQVLGGLLYPDTGLMECDQPTGFVFQNPDHQVVMPTVAADVAFGLGRYRLPESQVEEAVAAALGLVNMSEFMHRATHTLSGGQRQRVAIAGALAEGPKVLLLDELTTFLDVEDQFGVLQAVKNITHKRRATAVWVTHRFARHLQTGSLA